MNIKDITGKRFGRLVAIKFDHRVQRHDDKGYRYFWLFKCDCGNKVVLERNGRAKSCGCLHKENCGNLFRTHGLRKHPLYKKWVSMKSRCFNENEKCYKDYGGRGIKVCKDWSESFLSFYNWAIQNGYEENLTIDRIDVNGNYEPNNCRWVDLYVQANNRRDSINITYNGETKTLMQWCRKLNLNYPLVKQRIKRDGKNFEQAIKSCKINSTI